MLICSWPLKNLQSFNTSSKLLRKFIHMLICSWPLKNLQSFNTSSHSQGVAREGTGLIHRTCGSNLLHNLLFTAIRTYRKSSTDHLTHGCNIRSNTEFFLCTSIVNTKACHDLIKDQKGTVLCGEIPKAL